MFSEEILNAVSPDIYQRFKTAIEIGKWPNGELLTKDQIDICVQAIIIYEQKHLPPDQRTAYVPPKKTPCSPESGEELVSWKNSE